MSGYINGKVEIFYGDNPPSNLNILWQKRIVTNNVESSELMQYNANLNVWQSLTNTSNATLENPQFTGNRLRVENLSEYRNDSLAIEDGALIGDFYQNNGDIKVVKDHELSTNFVFQGDSRTAKLALNGVPVETQYPSLGVPYPNQLMLLDNFKERGNYINTNQFGTDVAGVLASYNTKVYPYRPGTVNGGVTIKESYLILEIGVNNVTNTSNVETIKSLANSVVNYAKQAEIDGFKVCLTCILFAEGQSYSTGIDVEKNRYEFNKILKQRASEYYMLIDMEHVFGANTDRTLYAEYEDGPNDPILHLNNIGNYIRANYINSLFYSYSNFIDNGYVPKLTNNNSSITEVTLSGTPFLVKEYHKNIIVSGGGSSEFITLFNPNIAQFNYGEITIRRTTGGDTVTIQGNSIDGATTKDILSNTAVTLMWDKSKNK